MTQLLCPHCGREIPENSPICVACGSLMPAGAPVAEAATADDQAVLDRLSAALRPTYVVTRLIGRGGFCDVFEIYDTHLNRRLAVKVLRADIAWAPGMVPRFEREIQSLAKLNHANIPPLYFVGDHEGLVYFAMPYIEGGSLGERVRTGGPMDPHELVDYMLPILDALAYAHGHGIIHRDIKPDNIMIEAASGRPLLADFGLAKHMAAKPGASLPGIVLGTPAYTSPEQILSEPDVDQRSDIYAIGATMFHLLTGTTIVTGDSARELITRQLTGEIPVPSVLNPRIPRWLSEVVLTALRRRPEDRYQSVSAMAEALRAGDRVQQLAPARAGSPIRNIRQDDPTPTMLPAAKLDQAARSTPPWLRRTQDVRLQKKRWTRNLYWILAAIVVSLGATWLIRAPIDFQLTNSLVLPIEIQTPDGSRRALSPGEVLHLRIGSDGKVLVYWRIIQPDQGGAGQSPGDPISGVIRLEQVSLHSLIRKKITQDVDSWLGERRSFAPRVTNRSTHPVTVSVQPRSRRRALQLLPGTTGLLGYYFLDDSSAVRVVDSRGRAVVFRGVEERIRSASGVVDLMVTDSLLEAVESGE